MAALLISPLPFVVADLPPRTISLRAERLTERLRQLGVDPDSL